MIILKKSIHSILYKLVINELSSKLGRYIDILLVHLYNELNNRIYCWQQWVKQDLFLKITKKVVPTINVTKSRKRTFKLSCYKVFLVFSSFPLFFRCLSLYIHAFLLSFFYSSSHVEGNFLNEWKSSSNVQIKIL